MAIIKCKMCGGDLNLIEGASTAECEFCGSVQTIPKVDDDKKLTLFARANRLRIACEFDKAAGIYEAIVADFPEEAEAYWGLVLCKYGIEYVDDPATGKKIPTCHRSSFDSIMEDSDFEQALENADGAARKVYREEAKQIEEIRKGIISVSSNEQPYDIFICYKETDENGDRTLDSVLAQDVYDALTDKGYRIFFSRITLEDKLGQEYEPYIFAALNSAKVMLAFGTDYEYFNAVWVKNEWSRFLKLMAKDKQKHLIPCYKGIDAYDMPKEFAKLQAQDLGKVGAMQDLLRGIEKLLPKQTAAAVTQTQTNASNTSNPTIESYLKRAFMFLEDGDWKSANEYCEKVLDIDPERAEAYLVKLLAESRVRCLEDLWCRRQSFEKNSNYLKVMRYGNETLKTTLSQSLAQYYDQKEAKKKKEEAYRRLSSVASIIHDDLLRYTGSEAVLVLPDGITTISTAAFSECTSLISITIPNSVTTIDTLAFSKCTTLTSINIPDSVITIGKSAFSGCTSLTGIVIPDSVITIGKSAFSGCTSLTGIVIPDSVTDIRGNPFDHCSSLEKVTVAESNSYYMSDDLGVVFSKDKKTLICVPAGLRGHYQIPDHVTTVGESAFSGCTNLTSIVIPDSVTTIRESAFSWCTGLTSITIPNSVTTIGQSAFDCCEGLTSITIPGSVAKIEGNPFEYCSNLTAITVANENGYYRSDDSGVLFTKDQATLIYIPAKLSGHYQIPDCVTSIGDHVLEYYASLTSITIPSSVTSIGTDVAEGFGAKRTIYVVHGSFAEKWAKENKLTTEEEPTHKCIRLQQEAEKEAAQKLRLAQERKGKGLCQHCGGELKGFFGKKCVSCGKPKDY